MKEGFGPDRQKHFEYSGSFEYSAVGWKYFPSLRVQQRTKMAEPGLATPIGQNKPLSVAKPETWGVALCPVCSSTN